MTARDIAATARPVGVTRLLERARRQLQDAGLTGSYLVRDLQGAIEISLDPDRLMPLASLVKVPLALAVLDGARQGDLDLSERVVVRPAAGEGASPGLGRFQHEADLALGDLVYLAVALSDNAAADALFEKVPPERVTAWLHAHGHDSLWVRHSLRDLAETPHLGSAGDADLAQVLATTGHTAGAGHRVRQLDIARASTGSARAVADLMQSIWSADQVIHPTVRNRVRELLAMNMHRQRLWPDFASDSAAWSSKTGTVLNLRHEVGVVEHRNGDRLVVAALTQSSVPATDQPVAEAAMAHVARQLHDALRGR